VTALPAGDVQKVLGDLLGVAVWVRAGGTPTGGAGVAGLYGDGTGRHSAAVWLERLLAACAGASLAAVEVGGGGGGVALVVQARSELARAA